MCGTWNSKNYRDDWNFTLNFDSKLKLPPWLYTLVSLFSFIATSQQSQQEKDYLLTFRSWWKVSEIVTKFSIPYFVCTIESRHTFISNLSAFQCIIAHMAWSEILVSKWKRCSYSYMSLNLIINLFLLYMWKLHIEILQIWKYVNPPQTKYDESLKYEIYRSITSSSALINGLLTTTSLAIYFLDRLSFRNDECAIPI